MIVPDSLAAGNVRLKISSGKEGADEGNSEYNEDKDQGQLVSKENLVVEVKKLLQQQRYDLQGDGVAGSILWPHQPL